MSVSFETSGQLAEGGNIFIDPKILNEEFAKFLNVIDFIASHSSEINTEENLRRLQDLKMRLSTSISHDPEKAITLDQFDASIETIADGFRDFINHIVGKGWIDETPSARPCFIESIRAAIENFDSGVIEAMNDFPISHAAHQDGFPVSDIVRDQVESVYANPQEKNGVSDLKTALDYRLRGIQSWRTRRARRAEFLLLSPVAGPVDLSPVNYRKEKRLRAKTLDDTELAPYLGIKDHYARLQKLIDDGKLCVGHVYTIPDNVPTEYGGLRGRAAEIKSPEQIKRRTDGLKLPPSQCLTSRYCVLVYVQPYLRQPPSYCSLPFAYLIGQTPQAI